MLSLLRLLSSTIMLLLVLLLVRMETARQRRIGTNDRGPAGADPVSISTLEAGEATKPDQDEGVGADGFFR